jgi:hypothetical protein
MGHANYGNLCDMWINLLYAKGRLTIGYAVEIAGRRGETLHASEGQYDADSGMVGQAIEEYCAFLTVDSQRLARQSWGWNRQWEGPFVEPILNAFAMAPKGQRLSVWRNLMQSLSDNPDDVSSHAIVADRIREEDLHEWATYVEELPKLRAAYERWNSGEDEDDENWETVDRIPWRFCKGKRMQYRDVPRLGNVTH